ncbi:precorrin-6y C5,15-methyltransferase (decarboxylating) subunit CbiE [Pseudomonas sp. RIT-PI-S]|uniref:precorrin-6y C5,15-methyltransferase (decarboxylating) subunit CbiE n=1 Tax=Pseudomonas sp. RIT-PI-S TaxID=3035295 RepID=UPI0021D7DDE2|nr:precorrin-6y C5,15-methyltransferase (decarboxylating) subunit CbiE [Pseudomonas sp. RIT-PI-S]
MLPWLTIIGIGEDGYPGLGKQARHALLQANLIMGAPRQLALLPACLSAERLPWPKPFSLEPVLQRRGTPVCVLASGDPMFHGVGASLARQLPPSELRVFSAPSSPSLAAARLGWALADTPVLSLVGRSPALLNRYLHDGTRLLVLASDGHTPAEVAQRLCATGFDASTLHVFEHLGGPQERCLRATAGQWQHHTTADLNLIALELVAGPDARPLACVPGLPDAAFSHDGQLTKRDVRALTLGRLAPRPGQLLWDVGAGCGSIGIEWMRAHPSCQAIAIEANDGRQGLIERNRDALGVPGLQLIPGRAPAALEGLPRPDAIFIGGGVTAEGVLAGCWKALKPGGRLVANAVTLESEMALFNWQALHGGELVRIQVAQARPLGNFHTWGQALPITLLDLPKPADA